MRLCLAMITALGAGCFADANLGSHTPPETTVDGPSPSADTVTSQDAAPAEVGTEPKVTDASDDEPMLDAEPPPADEAPADEPPPMDEPAPTDAAVPECGDAAIEHCVGELEHECDGVDPREPCINMLREICTQEIETACADVPPPDEPPPVTEDAGMHPPEACTPVTDDPCLLCEVDACCEQRVACLDNAACHCRMECRTAEQPDVCMATCDLASDLFDPWLGCIEEHCTTQC